MAEGGVKVQIKNILGQFGTQCLSPFNCQRADSQQSLRQGFGERWFVWQTFSSITVRREWRKRGESLLSVLLAGYCFGHLGLNFAGDPLRECLICSRTAYPRAVIFSHLLLPLTVESYLLSEFSGHSGISRPSPNRLGTFLQVQLQDGRDKYLRWRGTIPCRCRISRSVRRMWKIPDRSDTD